MRGNTPAQHDATGRGFGKKPRRRVMLADRLAQRLITVTGIGSIAAVSLVGLFLLWVVLPLLLPARVDPERRLPAAASTLAAPAGPAAPNVPDAPVLAAQVMDGYGSLALSLFADGTILVQDLHDGAVLDSLGLRPQSALTSWFVGSGGQKSVFGFADGSVMTALLDFPTEFIAEQEVPPAYRDLQPGQSRPWHRGLLARTPEGQFRYQFLQVKVDPVIPLGPDPILLVDIADIAAGNVVAALDARGVFHHRRLTFKANLLTGETTLRTQGGSTPLGMGEHSPAYLRLADTGDLAWLIHTDGLATLLERTPAGFAAAGTQDLLPDDRLPRSSLHVTAAAFLAGHASLAVGDSEGGITVWFPILGQEGRTTVLEPAHRLPVGPGAVTVLGASSRSRMLAAGYGDGSFLVFQVTAARILGRGSLPGSGIRQITLSPQEDLLLAAGAQGAGLWKVQAPYAEVSLKTLLRPVWYEGYPGPAYVWQSSSGSDTFEPKMSLMPLIYGTLKAAFYSLLFGLPLAILAAFYTSEFLPKRTRARVKPVIEIMASLPSVVLGFLAALVMAPLVEAVAVEVIAVMVTAPFCVLLGAHLWQLLPRHLAARLDAWRPAAVLAFLGLGAVAGLSLGPFWEGVAFGGDFKLWLDGQIGTGVAGWVVLLLAPAGMFIGWMNIRYGEGFLRSAGPQVSPRRLALLDLARFLASACLAVALALFMGWLLNGAGWDPRGSVLGTYVQRNALIVGIAMGFAVIPIIYSISEDALVSVPDHLRAASLGAGATAWQTAVLVVMPPAMSGLFSAAMIGVGRAVGETMIVLMAAGNTPIMDMNIFNGFRTLSANLAVELPEAVQGSTHYRTLFLAALALFAMTFVLNTAAEGVRLHFRKKTSRL